MLTITKKAFARELFINGYGNLKVIHLNYAKQLKTFYRFLINIFSISCEYTAQMYIYEIYLSYNIKRSNKLEIFVTILHF